MRRSVIWRARMSQCEQGMQGSQGGVWGRLCWVLLLSFLFSASARAGLLDFLLPSGSNASYQITDYRPVSKTLVSGSSLLTPQYDYVYRVEVHNKTASAVYLLGTVSSRRSSVSVKEAETRFGRVAGNGTALSSDTITIRAGKFFDRRLDRRITRNGKDVFEEEGEDPEDKGIPGLPPGLAQLGEAWLADYYAHKLSTVFSWAYRGDTTTPIISGQSPKDTVLASPATVIAALFSDDNGIDPANITLIVDGQNVTANAQVSSTGIQYQPTVKLVDGPHTVMLKVTDLAGNAAESSWSFGVDAVGPVITGPQPANGSWFEASTAPIISASFADSGIGVELTATKLFVDEVGVTAIAQVTATGISYSPVQPLTEGGHTVKLVVTDKHGNSTESSWSFLTQSLPEITAVAPKDVFFNAAQLPTITAEYRDIGSGIDTTRVHLVLDGIDVTSQAQIVAQGLTLLISSPLQEGTHSLSLSVADKAGNTASTQWQFVVDAHAPQIGTLLPASDRWVNTAQPTISASFGDGAGVAASGIDPASIKLLFNGVDVTQQAVVTADYIQYVPGQYLTDGEHAIVLSIADKAGNQTESSWRIRLDATGPVLTGAAPAEGTVLPADALPQLQAAFTDAGAGVAPGTVKVVLDGMDVTAQASLTESGLLYATPQALPEGAHTVAITVADLAGNSTTYGWGFKTATAPVIFAETPKDRFVPAAVPPTISANFSDIGAGIDTAAIRLEFNGTDVTPQSQTSESGISYITPQLLQDGKHTVRLSVADKAGNPAISQWEFGSAQPPEISGLTPKDVILAPGSQPMISAQFADARVGINAASVRMIVNGTDVTAQASVSETGVSYTPSAPLVAGPVTVYLEVSNQTNGTAQSVWGFEVDTLATYSVKFTNPIAGATVLTPKIEVRATAEANKTYATTLTVNGQPMRVESTDGGGIQYVATVALSDGANDLAVAATFADGQTRSVSTVVNYDAPPKITITAPVDRVTLGAANATSPRDLTGNVERPVSIAGRVNKPVASVTVNQQRAVLSEGTDFRFDNFFLHEGSNLLTVVATDSLGRTGTSSITVSVDQTAPILSVEHPLQNSVTSNSRIDVRGVVNDAVEGLVGSSEPEVTVNGVRAQVADRYYLATDVPLQVGLNTLSVVATDQAGNSRRIEFPITRLATGTNRLTLLSGNHQKAAPGMELPKSLTVVALNKNGEPLANLPVTFDVMRGTGSISTQQGQVTKVDGVNPARNLVVNTNASGHASVWLTTGKKTGVGANVVRAHVAQSTGIAIAEDAFFAATTERGLPALVVADMGANQYAEIGTEPLEPLTAVVNDGEGNPVPNVLVTFRIEEGEAFLLDSTGAQLQSITVNTDKNGVAAVRPLLGQTAGTIRLSAKTMADPGNAASGEIGQAAFLIQARAPQDGPTRFHGFVYTDKGEPMSGVRMSVGRTNLSVTTDEVGAFVLEGVPPGRLDLFVDARTSTFQNKQWPALHFEVIAIRGVDNQLPHPIYLPPLVMSAAQWVGGNEDVVLTMPGLDGFQMKVKANSVTFPDGSHEGLLVVSPVVSDRLPMTPPGGNSASGYPAWTIQPSGTRFDPPIEVTMPNITGLKPGDTVPVVQWDHDLAQFVPMGRSTVTEDGAFLVTDLGTGISKAGWGEPTPPPPPPRCAKGNSSCPDCQQLDTSSECPACKFHDDGFPFPTEAQSLSINFSDWGPAGGFKKLMKRAFNTEVSLNLSFSGEKAKTHECCAARNGKSEKESGTGTLGLSGQFTFPLNALAGPVGRAAYEAGIKVFVRGSANGSGSAQMEFGDCAGKLEISPTGQFGGTFDIGIGLGELDGAGPNGDVNRLTIFGVEGSAGLDLTLQFLPPQTPGVYFEMAESFNFFIQAQLSFLNGSWGGFRYTYPLTYQSTERGDVLFR